jgi:(2Fe-2S) ferredoxin
VFDGFLDDSGDPWAWDDFLYYNVKDPDIKAILQEAAEEGAFVAEPDYAKNEEACMALRRCASRLRALDAQRRSDVVNP